MDSCNNIYFVYDRTILWHKRIRRKYEYDKKDVKRVSWW